MPRRLVRPSVSPKRDSPAFALCTSARTSPRTPRLESPNAMPLHQHGPSCSCTNGSWSTSSGSSPSSQRELHPLSPDHSSVELLDQPHRQPHRCLAHLDRRHTAAFILGPIHAYWPSHKLLERMRSSMPALQCSAMCAINPVHDIQRRIKKLPASHSGTRQVPSRVNLPPLELRPGPHELERNALRWWSTPPRHHASELEYLQAPQSRSHPLTANVAGSSKKPPRRDAADQPPILISPGSANAHPDETDVNIATPGNKSRAVETISPGR